MIGNTVPPQPNATSTFTKAVASEWLMKFKPKCCLFSTREVISITHHFDSPALSLAPVLQSKGIAFAHGSVLRLPTEAVKSWSAIKRT